MAENTKAFSSAKAGDSKKEQQDKSKEVNAPSASPRSTDPKARPSK
jgi:hypothetical protein